MSKFDPLISPEQRAFLRGWQDGDISIVNGTCRVYDETTRTWPKRPLDLTWFKDGIVVDGNWRADGIPYQERGIPSEDLFIVAGRAYSGLRRKPVKPLRMGQPEPERERSFLPTSLRRFLSGIVGSNRES